MSNTIITDNHDRQGIVIGETEAPELAWINMQSIKPSLTGRWFTVYPLTGGAACVNEADMRFKRDATEEEFNSAYHNANSFAREKLDKMR